MPAKLHIKDAHICLDYKSELVPLFYFFFSPILVHHTDVCVAIKRIPQFFFFSHLVDSHLSDEMTKIFAASAYSCHFRCPFK